jgi:hypothetical protein
MVNGIDRVVGMSWISELDFDELIMEVFLKGDLS